MIFERYDPATDQMVPCGARTATCGTAGCRNENVALVIPDDGLAVQCGSCWHPITDITPA